MHVSKLRDKRIPASFDAARHIPDWAEAINRAFNALVRRGTWEYVHRTPQMYVLSYTWNFSIKDAPGQHVKLLHKAECCLRGDKQRPYFDFHSYEVCAPVARLDAIRCIIAKVAAPHLIFEGADVSNAYLYGDLEVTVFLEKPTDYSGLKRGPGKVCKAHKSIYGMTEAGKIWGNLRHSKFISWGFKQSAVDKWMYIMYTQNRFAIILVVVDDMAIASDSLQLMAHIKQLLIRTFKVKLFDPLTFFIGCSLNRTAPGIYVSQRKYLEGILQEHHLYHGQPVATPFPVNTDLTVTIEGDVDLTPTEHSKYRSQVGLLLVRCHLYTT